MNDAVKKKLLDQLTPDQSRAVQSDSRCLMVLAGAGSGKTEVMARRVAYAVASGVSKDSIVAFTFTEAAAEELKFRIRKYIQISSQEGVDSTLGGMYVGTIHGFCIKSLRDFEPDVYHNYEILDEGARLALVSRQYHLIMGLKRLGKTISKGQFETINYFLRAYDLLNEHGRAVFSLPDIPFPQVGKEKEYCEQAKLLSNVGISKVAQAFASSAARYYSYMRCRRFLDFSTSQNE